MKLKRTFCLLTIYFLLANRLLFGQNFCVPTFKLNSFGIDNFAFHTLVNLYSGMKSSGYTFYSDSSFTTTINLGQKYPITISLRISAGLASKFAAMLDYNGDNLFDSSELIYYESNNCYSTSGFVTIPNDTHYLGKRILRIIMADFPFGVNPCGSYYGGEAEDYVVNIVSNKPETQSYCMPFNILDDDGYIIDDFRFANLVNKKSGSNSSGYIFYPLNQFSTNLFLNSSDSVYISTGKTAGITGGFSIWIDLNNDGDFANSERLFSSGRDQLSAKGVITIPNDSSFIGIRRLRVRSQWGTIPTEPCGLYSSGETEDYLVNISKKITSEIRSIQNSSNLSIYPNPSKGIFTILSDKIVNEVLVTNSIGEIIYQLEPQKEKVMIQIDIPGIYFIKSVIDGKIIINKLTVTY